MEDDLTIRPMTEADVAVACALAEEAGWRSRRAFYDLALRLPNCRPLVGERAGSVVATGVATTSGPVGWVGTIVVAMAERGRGYGRAMTVAVCDVLRDAGCESLALIATALGRPLYERLGFAVDNHYHLMEGDYGPLAPVPPIGTRVRPVRADDLPAITRLDATATAEDRTPVLEALASSGGWVLEPLATVRRTDEILRGFLLPSDRGYAAIVAPRFEDGRYLAELHRFLAGPGRHARAGIPDTSPAAIRALEATGWREAWLAPRMVMGRPIQWRPDWVWGQVNFAMG